MYIFETIFDLTYLIFVMTLGILILRRAGRERRLLGWMAVVLAGGDAFHLAPRVVAMWSPGGFPAFTAALGLGQAVSSVTMTLYYVLLYHAYDLGGRTANRRGMNALVYALAGLRAVLCLMPQNGWTLENPSVLWSWLRNLPFFLLGAVIVVLCLKKALRTGDLLLKRLGLAIVLSFLCYGIVVIFAAEFPWTGIFMLPKTALYAWMTWMGFKAAEQGYTRIDKK